MGTNSDKVCAILLNWNGKADTLECLGSLKKLAYPSVEIFLVDNGSSDGSAQAVRSAFPEVRVIENAENLGFCKGCNTGIQRALESKPGYLLLLNNDTVVDPLLVGKLKAVVDSDERIAAVNPVINIYGSKDEPYFHGTRIDWANGDLCSQYSLDFVLSGKNRLLETDFATWCAMLMKASVFEKVGGLDGRFFAYYEDTDWSLRAKRLGLRTVLLPETLVQHKNSRSTGGRYSPTVYFYLFRNRLLFIKKHAPVIRKLQFAHWYVTDVFRKYGKLKAGQPEHAQAVLDGFWSAANGCWGQGRLRFPGKWSLRQGFWLGAYLRLLTLRAVW